MTIQSSAIELKDVITWSLAGLAIIVSVFSLLWNRYYARSLFETANYPALEFRVHERTRSNRRGDLLRFDSTTVESSAGLVLDARNMTAVNAIDIEVRFTMTKGMKRIISRDSPDDWQLLGQFASATVATYHFIEISAAKLSPSTLEIVRKPPEKVTPNAASFDTIVLTARSTAIKDRFGLIVEYSWRPPLKSKRVHAFRSFLWGLSRIGNQLGVDVSGEAQECDDAPLHL